MKRIILTIFLLCPFVFSQLPDAPSTVQPPTCQNGNPFQRGTVGRLVGSCPFDKQPEVKWGGRPDGFFHFSDGRRALHPDKSSWAIFIASHAALWGATVFAVRRHVSSHEEAHSEYPAVAFLTGMDFLAFKTISPVVSVGAPIYGIQHYIRAGLR